jgi:excinuclease ABC subunit A
MASEPGYIKVRGARVHNLKNIDVDIPRNKFVVITGISGSGKSSLAFDTLYAEGQRRYVESLSAYARQFLGMMDKPDVDEISGLSPAISIQQRSSSRNPRSTVGTVTEIFDYLRVLFARIGLPYCYNCDRKIESQTTDQIVDNILGIPDGTRIEILAPVVRGRKGEYKEFLTRLKRRGYVRARVDGKVYEIEAIPELERYKKHDIEIVIDRLVVKDTIRKRLADSVEMGLREGEGILTVLVSGADEKVFSQSLACVHCGISYPELTPRMFSFNSPYGACPVCDGLGTKMDIDPNKVLGDPKLTIMTGAIKYFGIPSRWRTAKLRGLANKLRFDLDTPYAKLPDKAKEAILYGDEIPITGIYLRRDGTKWEFEDCWEGIVPELLRRYKETTSQAARLYIEDFMVIKTCPACQGARLKPESLAIRVGEKNIAQIARYSVKAALHFFENLKLSRVNQQIGGEIIKEIIRRLGFLNAVGLDYLTIERTTDTLAGGEEQRVRLATQIGSGLVGVLYILDEPSIGLHQRDNRRLLNTLYALRDLGNTVLVVEHDAETIRSADYVVDLGPGAGQTGGYVVATGTPEAISRDPKSVTGHYLSGVEKIEVPRVRKPRMKSALLIKGARGNNLKNIDVEIPLGLFVGVTGVSGSGKSTLIVDTLYQALAGEFYGSRYPPGEYAKIVGKELVDKVVNIDQSPIGRTPRSNPVTYTGAFTVIRDLFSSLPEAKVRGYKPGRFSFNVSGGRCEQCEGGGILKIEMHFLPDVYITCDACQGRRFNRETLDIRYKSRNISEVLDMAVTEALDFFQNIPQIRRKMELLNDVGLGYIKLGQSATTLSGGEAQRIKLAKELSKIATGRTIYFLDEPTTGLHFQDVKLLLKVLQRLVDKGNTVVVIEHNLEVIKCADWIIDLGPEGGEEGGRVICVGTPEEVARQPQSYTGRYLKKVLNTT